MKVRPLYPRERFAILKRDNFACRYCGAKAPDVKLHVDHVHPRSLGGTNDPSNLVTACEDCNMGKSAGLVGDLVEFQFQRAHATELFVLADLRFGAEVAARDLDRVIWWCVELDDIDLIRKAVLKGERWADVLDYVEVELLGFPTAEQWAAIHQGAAN